VSDSPEHSATRISKSHPRRLYFEDRHSLSKEGSSIRWPLKGPDRKPKDDRRAARLTGPRAESTFVSSKQWSPRTLRDVPFTLFTQRKERIYVCKTR